MSMKKINSIKELKDGQTVYLEVNVKLLGNEETVYPVDLYTTYGTYLDGLTSDFLLESDVYESEQKLFTFEPLEIGKEYEFSDFGTEWKRDIFQGYCTLHHFTFANHVRHIQQNEDEVKAIELLKSLGYKIEK